MLQPYYYMREYSKSTVNGLHGKKCEISKDIRKGVNFLLCLNSSLERFLTNFYLNPLWN